MPTSMTSRATRSASRPHLRSSSRAGGAAAAPPVAAGDISELGVSSSATRTKSSASAQNPPRKRTLEPRSATGSASRSKAATKAISTTRPDVANTEPPSTPPKKRQRRSAADETAPSPPREGPQHHDDTKLDSLAEQHVLEEEEPHVPKPLPARPAGPLGTNATLQTPRGSRIVAYRKDGPQGSDKLDTVPESPSQATTSKRKSAKASKAKPEPKASASALAEAGDGAPAPTTDTNRLLADAVAHLISVDARLKPIIDAHHCHIFSPEGLAEPVEPFRALVSGILAQQVSGAAASAIKKRFVALFVPAHDPDPKTSVRDEDPNSDAYLTSSDAFPAPAEVAKADIGRLRSAGLSQRKAEYVQGLAEKFASGELSASILAHASYDEVLEKLIAVRGLGRWSVEMFACFGLKRMDVFSTGDLGVQRGMAAFVGRDVAKLKNKGGKWKYMSEQEMVDMAEKFRPYRSLFMWYMWKVEDVDISAVQGS